MARTIEVKGLEEALKVPGEVRQAARKAASRTTNTGARRVKTKVSVKAREKTTVKAAYAKKGITIPYRSTPNKIGTKVVVSGKRIPLIGYEARQTKKGVTGRIYKAEPRILRPRAFIAVMKSGHKGVFWRDKRFDGGKGKQGDAWSGDLKSFYTMLNAIKRKYPNSSKDLVIRLGITELHGPSLPDLVGDDKVWTAIQDDVNAFLPVEMDRNLDYYLSQVK